MAQLNFDANNVSPDESFEAIPAAWYNFMITESENKATKNGDGSYLQLTLKVMDGQYAGRLVFDRLNLQNPNPVATEIGYKRLSAYCHATGILQVQDSSQLHGIPFKGRVVIKTDSTGAYDPSNEIKAVKNINEIVAGAPAGQPAQGGFAQPQAQPQFQQPAQGFAQQPQQGFAPQQAAQGFAQPAQQQPQAQGFAQPAQGFAQAQAQPQQFQQPQQQAQPAQQFQQPAQQAQPQQQVAQPPFEPQAQVQTQGQAQVAQTGNPAAAAAGNPPPWAQQPTQ